MKQVQHLDDLLLRRTRLGMCLADGGSEEICAGLLESICIEPNWGGIQQQWQD